MLCGQNIFLVYFPIFFLIFFLFKYIFGNKKKFRYLWIQLRQRLLVLSAIQHQSKDMFTGCKSHCWWWWCAQAPANEGKKNVFLSMHGPIKWLNNRDSLIFACDMNTKWTTCIWFFLNESWIVRFPRMNFNWWKWL